MGVIARLPYLETGNYEWGTMSDSTDRMCGEQQVCAVLLNFQKDSDIMDTADRVRE